MTRMGKGKIGITVLVGTLLALLLAALYFAYGLWTAVETEPLPAGLYVALVLGVLFSVLVGSGLMALMFYSSRHGYDERASGERREG
jgi:NO-binding membrane sensor protein with MHYT domain